ncbi:MAG: LysM peptidoglycan-binding domain-containing protein [Candidatus Wallacebacter cryptica]|jgi:hypothetical protein
MNQAANSRRSTVIIMAAAAIIVLSLAGIALAMNQSQTNNAATATAEITVSYGDTLWTIAQRIAPGIDPRKVVWEIQTMNEIESARIFPGQTLQVPLYETNI